MSFVTLLPELIIYISTFIKIEYLNIENENIMSIYQII